MKPLYHSAPHSTFDLTECKLHRLVEDGKARFIVCYPKAWTEGSLQEMTVFGGIVMMRPYLITEWQEVELEVK